MQYNMQKNMDQYAKQYAEDAVHVAEINMQNMKTYMQKILQIVQSNINEGCKICNLICKISFTNMLSNMQNMQSM